MAAGGGDEGGDGVDRGVVLVGGRAGFHHEDDGLHEAAVGQAGFLPQRFVGAADHLAHPDQHQLVAQFFFADAEGDAGGGVGRAGGAGQGQHAARVFGGAAPGQQAHAEAAAPAAQRGQLLFGHADERVPDERTVGEDPDGCVGVGALGQRLLQ